MNVINLKDCAEFISGDGAILRELLHRDKGDYKCGYSLAHAIIKPGTESKPHILKTSEVYYITQGRGKMYIDKETREVGVGDCVYIPPMANQHIANIGKEDLVFLCIVDPAWRKEDEVVLG